LGRGKGVWFSLFFHREGGSPRSNDRANTGCRYGGTETYQWDRKPKPGNGGPDEGVSKPVKERDITMWEKVGREMTPREGMAVAGHRPSSRTAEDLARYSKRKTLQVRGDFRSSKKLARVGVFAR